MRSILISVQSMLVFVAESLKIEKKRGQKYITG